MSRKAVLQQRLLLQQCNHSACPRHSYFPPSKRRCFSQSVHSYTHSTAYHRSHDHVPYPTDFPECIGHKAKEKQENKEFFLDLLSSATTKREARSYLSRFTPPKPSSDSTRPNEQAANLPPVIPKGESLEALLKPQSIDTVFDLASYKAMTSEKLHVALVKIKNPQLLDDACLHGICKTLSQLSRLAMSCCIVVDVDSSTPNTDHRGLASTQTNRIVAGIDKVHSLGARRLDSIVSLDGPTQTPVVLSRKTLLSPLYRGQIAVVDPIGYTSDTSTAFSVLADELVLALTKELAGLSYRPAPRESSEETKQKIKKRKEEVSVERLIVLDPLGGIPSISSKRHKSHVFVNLKQEFADIYGELTHAAEALSSHKELTSTSIQTSELEGHLANLNLLQKALAILPPSSSALITTPQDATNLAKPQSGPSGGLTVGTRQRRNPLIHNLLTDKPVYSASLPLHRRCADREKTEHGKASEPPPHSTFVKLGMPLTMLPDPRLKCWTAPTDGESRINLNDPAIDLPRLVHLIDDSFNRKLDVKHYLDRVHNRLAGLIIAGEYEGGAILTWETPPGVPDDGSPESKVRMVPYLDKFAVLKRSQGAGGVADIVFNAMVRTCFPKGVCWRSRKDNPVNKWYFERSRGTWKLPDSNWTMFWTTENVPENEQLFEDYEGVCRSIQPSWADNKKEID